MIDPSILRAMLAAGATAEMIVVAVEAAYKVDVEAHRASKEYERERKRNYRLSRGLPGTDGTTPPLSPPMINNSTPPLPTPKPIKSTLDEPLFEDFWGVYPRKIGKGAARKAYRNALKRASEAEILAGAKAYAASKPDPKYTAHATTWLNADRWLDEPERKPGATVVGFRKEFKPEPEGPKISEEERQRNLAKLTNLVSGTLKWNK
jgi:hypothetical protein